MFAITQMRPIIFLRQKDKFISFSLCSMPSTQQPPSVDTGWSYADSKTKYFLTTQSKVQETLSTLWAYETSKVRGIFPSIKPTVGLLWVVVHTETSLWRPRARCQSTRWWGAACPPLSATRCPSTACASLHLTMLLPSPASGTLCLRWRRWRNLQGNSSTVGRCSKNPFFGWRTLVSGCATTPAVGPTTCTGSTGTWAPGPEHHRRRLPVLWRHGGPAPCGRLLDPDHEGGGDRGQQVPLASSQAVPWLQDQGPAAPPGPSSPAQATLHHQEAQYLLLDAGPPCPLLYPNKLLRKTRKKKTTMDLLLGKITPFSDL